MKAASVAGATPPLPSSPATLTSTRTSVSGSPMAAELLQGRVGGDRVDQAAERQQLLHLAALQVADEVPLEGIAPALVLGDQVLLAVLADQASPRPRRAPPSPPAARTWSRRGSRRPDPAISRARSRLAAIFAGSSPWIRPGIVSPPPRRRQTRPAWRPVRPSSRRCEKKSSDSQLVQSPLDSIRSTPASRKRSRATSGKVDAADGPKTEPGCRFRPVGGGWRRAARTSSPTS